ncbi:MAG: glucosyl-3-phosphoglycerate synthase [Thermoleophilaceae bacterium]
MSSVDSLSELDGLPSSLDVWLAARSYRAEAYTTERLLAAKTSSVSVILPGRSVAEAVGGVIDALLPLEEIGLIDELLVVDAASPDGTAEIARARGATVLQESELLPGFGPARGKGDAMWRALSATRGEIVAFLDADTEDFHAGFLLGLLGPLFEDPELQLLKGSFRRPLRVGHELVPDGGGRVTELLARPLINLYAPELSGFRQPLAGEVSGRRELFEALPFPVGYGVEIAMLIDAVRAVGLDALGQVDLGTRQNRHQSLRALGAMSSSVMYAALSRVLGPDVPTEVDTVWLTQPVGDELEVSPVAVEERPPLAVLTPDGGRAAAALAGP